MFIVHMTRPLLGLRKTFKRKIRQRIQPLVEKTNGCGFPASFNNLISDVTVAKPGPSL